MEVSKDAFSVYGLGIRASVRGLWSGALDLFEFVDSMFAVVRRGLRRAWNEGMRQAGLQPTDITPPELTALEQRINDELGFVFPFGEDIEAGSKANKGKLGPLLKRAEAWTLRAVDVANQAKTMAQNDPKLMWVWDPVKEHCTSCQRLNGKVKRASFWRAKGVRPQNPPNGLLVCGGWKCGCTLDVTNAPLSRGPLPRLP